jgi:hypothetical protein
VYHLRKATGQADVNVEIRKRTFGWVGHTVRIDEGEIPKAALTKEPSGKQEERKTKK